MAQAPAGQPSQPTKSTETPLSSLPYTPGLDLRAMDKAVDPCVDFYQYSCGGWMKSNPIPPDQAAWNVYRKLAQDNQRFLWGILDGLARPGAGRTAVQQKIGDHFAACMDETTIEKLGSTPLRLYLDRIARMTSKQDLPKVLAELQMVTADDGLFFGFDSDQDFSDATKVIAFASAGGIGLPDRDYYLKDDDKSKETRAQYVAHVTKSFELLGDTHEAAERNAGTVMSIETALAKATLSRVDRRDPYNLFHKLNFEGLQSLTPGFDWSRYLRAVGLNRLRAFNVTEPAFYKELARQWSSLSLDDIKIYLRWHVTRGLSQHLSSAFVKENFDFYSRTLRGVQEMRPRWKRCVALVDDQLGEALGQEYVKRAFGPKLKADTLRMTLQIEKAMAADIEALDWMTPPTKQRALEKLRSVVNKIGYPDKWRDYSKLEIKAGQYIGNVERANLFEKRRRLAKIGKPLERKEWFMTPPTVNAYYNPQMNDINFPAGILQPPLYDPAMDDAPNYGNTGATIGHELTHGFDDQGRKFDAKGNLKDWWTAKDDEEFSRRSQCIVDQYAEYTVVDDIKINSKLTLGEDVADLGGLILAWMAWTVESANKNLESRDGLTPDQRFFIGNAQWGCENDRPENQRVRALTDPHSPARYRINGLVVNMPEFEKAFTCKPGQPMVRENRCRVW
ncbi:MAG: M13 family metallopeptidase [Burkholderiaceae bacterium]